MKPDWIKRPLFKTLLLFLSLLAASGVPAASIDTILADEEPPAGVVFEIVGGEPGELGDLLATVKRNISELRARFPGIPVAVVTHGREQFDLTEDNRRSRARAHSLVRELVDSNGIEVHVCGTHAEWEGKTPEDFPDYVNVSAAGPAQINDYAALGYEVIILP